MDHEPNSQANVGRPHCAGMNSEDKNLQKPKMTLFCKTVWLHVSCSLSIWIFITMCFNCVWCKLFRTFKNLWEKREVTTTKTPAPFSFIFYFRFFFCLHIYIAKNGQLCTNLVFLTSECFAGVIELTQCKKEEGISRNTLFGVSTPAHYDINHRNVSIFWWAPLWPILLWTGLILVTCDTPAQRVNVLKSKLPFVHVSIAAVLFCMLNSKFVKIKGFLLISSD